MLKVYAMRKENHFDGKGIVCIVIRLVCKVFGDISRTEERCHFDLNNWSRRDTYWSKIRISLKV